ncbi:hypothetical protein [Sporolactobacillus pectinivorans]|uniref:hypothetical protein n=1 Tax=Sporolactobacillus pectinivorans TaxID=1591408 RepID=UPI001960B9E6|nr:hypothetical protein [Sporolactobacillus pectinivorans]
MEKHSGMGADRERDEGHSSFFGNILGTLRKKDVTTVYGEPIVLADKRVVPVASLRMAGGGGGGVSAETEKPSTDPGSGSGGGGYLSVRPLGVFEITKDKTRFKPAYNVTFLVLVLSIFTFGLAVLIRKSLK